MNVLCFILLFGVSVNKAVAEIKYFDLGYDYQENVTFYYSKEWSFRRTPFEPDPEISNIWFSAYYFHMAEHGGTHIDAPLHMWKSAWSVDEIPLDRLFNLALVVVDVTKKVEKEPDYAYAVEDFVDWEKEHGLIPEGSVVLVKSGWSKYYPDREKFIGLKTDNITGKQTHNYPGFHTDAASFLSTERKVYGVGTESVSLDNASGFKNFPAHVAFFKHNVWGLEMVRNMDGIPATGARISVLPLKAKRGSGGPSRVIITWNTDIGVRCGANLIYVFAVAFLAILAVPTNIII